MRKITIIVTMIVALTALHDHPVAYADVITLVADEWCPYNCTPDTDHPGFMIEIAQYAFEQAGHTIAYTTIPWARAIQKTRSGQYDGIVGTGLDETPDFIFPEHELGLAAHTFFVKQGASWKYTGLDSLEQISLGVTRGYSYGNLFEVYIQPNQGDPERIQIVSGETGLMQNIRKLLLERVDAIIEDRSVFQYYLHQTKNTNRFSEAGVAYLEKVYIAFSPKNPSAKQYARILSNAMMALRASGKLTEILERYGLHDWAEAK